MTFSTPPRTPAPAANPIAIRRDLWQRLIYELAARGGGRRESGAFLLAAAGSRDVTDLVYLDDLDPKCLTGNISFDGKAYGKLWDRCTRQNSHVVADLHTHPAMSVGQSPTDRANPMIAAAGHLAIIVPHFATRNPAPEDVGVHLYLGGHKWRSHYARQAAAIVQIRGNR
jgi:proteasome lid subunit RPN8/RPN11